MMKKIVDMSVSELGAFVSRNGACSEGDGEIFLPPLDGEFKTDRDRRIDNASEFCGSCVVQKPCLQIAVNEGGARVTGAIYGGFYFGTHKAINVVTKVEYAKSDILSGPRNGI